MCLCRFVQCNSKVSHCTTLERWRRYYKYFQSELRCSKMYVPTQIETPPVISIIFHECLLRCKIWVLTSRNGLRYCKHSHVYTHLFKYRLFYIEIRADLHLLKRLYIRVMLKSNYEQYCEWVKMFRINCWAEAHSQLFSLCNLQLWYYYASLGSAGVVIS